jgi:hypothetical protein
VTTTSKPRRRWFQYSLRTLLVLMLAACIGMGWIAMKRQQARRGREAAEAIERLGGKVFWSNADSPEESGAWAWLRKLLGDDLFVHPDDVVIHSRAQVIADAGLEHLKGLTQLETLYIDSDQITDAGLQHLQGLTHLRDLMLVNTQVSDSGLAHLRGLTQLQGLSLDSTQVTDAGLEHLKGLARLRELDLQGTQVSDNGVGELQQALPNCRISR